MQQMISQAHHHFQQVYFLPAEADKIFSFRSFFCFAAGVKRLAFGACKCTLEATPELHEEELELVEAMQS